MPTINRKPITISLPDNMVREIDLECKRRHSTRSELMREAFRSYVRTPVVSPTKAERRDIQQGRAEIEKGEYITLKELEHELGITSSTKGKKTARSGSLRR